ncbi:MAG TPA: LamG-like jellyroll fold domain-containing protein, partial [Polyangiaceae bacterium]
VTVSLTPTGAHLYVDGWEVARDTAIVVSPAALGATNSNWIGKWAVPEASFAGRIDEFYVYDGEISSADIRQLAWPKTDYSIWHFDEASGTVAVDSSDNHRDATMVRATFNSGVIGNSAQLYNPSNDDTPPADADQYVQLPAGVVQDCTLGYTVAAWINVIATRSHARVFEFSNNTATAIFGRTMGGSTQQWALGDASGTLQYASIDYVWPIGTWHHVAAVRDGLVLHAYIDGREQGAKTPFTMPTGTPPASSLGNTLNNYIGRTRDSAASNERRRLHGFVDEFLLSCRPYTSDEVKQLATKY